MITIERRQARRLRSLFRRSVLGIAHRGSIPPLVLRAELTQLRAQYRYGALALEHVQPGTYRPAEAIALPLDALADCESRDDSPVVLESIAPDRTIVRWEDRGIPQTREYQAVAFDASPEPPTAFEPAAPGLLDALADASAIAAQEATRYALNCIQLKGAGREIVATDGRQLLIQGGYTFPFEADFLLRRSPIFACKALPHEEPLTIGATDTHVVLRTGPWTLFLEIQTDLRFPKVDSVLPDLRAATTQLQLDAEDARFLLPALDRLPGADDSNAPMTLDLNGQVAIRAKAPDQSGVTELVLARSQYTGAPVRLNTNRAFLARALRLGFSEIAITAAESPVVCRDRTRSYCWQPLSEESAIAPTDDVTRIESGPATRAPAHQPGKTPKAKSLMNEPARKIAQSDGIGLPVATGQTNGTSSTQGAGSSTLTALIEEAVVLHEVLGDARSRTQRLVAGLRRHKKQTRLMSSALVALKQLRLQEATD
jgi:hypothetical protein